MQTIYNKSLRFLLTISIVICSIYSHIAVADDTKAAEEFISTISNNSLTVIQSKITEDKKIRKLEEIFIDVVDINWMAKFAIAKFWKTMSDDEKNRYLTAYRQYLVKTYVPKFKEYNNQIIKITGSKDIGNGQYQVMTQIVTTKDDDRLMLNITYRCKKNDDKFKIRDITGEDFSLLSTQRSEFSAVIEKGGVDKLIKNLENK